MIKADLLLLVLCSLTVSMLASTQLPQVRTTSNSDPTSRTDLMFVQAAASGDYAVVVGTNGTTNTSRIHINILKRNQTGFYAQFARHVLDDIHCTSVSTNGKWFAAVLAKGDVEVFQVTSDGQISQLSVLTPSNGTSNVQLLTDNSLVLMSENSATTYEYSSGQWTIIDYTELNATLGVNSIPVHVTDTTLACLNNAQGTVYLYNRQADKSWSLADTFSFQNKTQMAMSIVWNGNDTVLLGEYYIDEENVGALGLYTKTGGEWSLKNTTMNSDIGIKPAGYVGLSLVIVDPNTILIPAPFDGIASSMEYRAGSVTVLTRQSGADWQYSARITTDELTVYGVAVAAIDDSLLVLSCQVLDVEASDIECRFHSLTRCFAEPINVTCINQQLESCDSLSNFDTMSLYTVNNPQCGTPQPTAKSFAMDDSSVKILVEFERMGVAKTTCEAVISCPAHVDHVSGARLVSAPLAVVSLVAFALFVL